MPIEYLIDADLLSGVKPENIIFHKKPKRQLPVSCGMRIDV